MCAAYDRIGIGYDAVRRPDPRLQALLQEALGDAETVVNVGAGAGSYDHWGDVRAGLAELRRVTRRQVIFTWDKDHDEELWVVVEYVPEIRTMEHARFPARGEIIDMLGSATVHTFLVPHDFSDGYRTAFWRRPEAYLDPDHVGQVAAS